MGESRKTQMADMKNEELCSYAALILADAGEEVTADKLNTLIKAAGVSVPAFYTQLFEKVAGMRAVSEMYKDAGKVGAGAPAAAGAPGGAPAAEAKKDSSSSDAGDVAGGGLFGEED